MKIVQMIILALVFKNVFCKDSKEKDNGSTLENDNGGDEGEMDLGDEDEESCECDENGNCKCGPGKKCVCDENGNCVGVDDDEGDEENLDDKPNPSN